MLIILFSLIGMFYFISIDMYRNYVNYHKLKNVSLQANKAIYASNVVHELQKERGLSAGFIGSNGTKFQSELTNQRKLTDQKRDEYLQFFQINVKENRASDLEIKINQFVEERESIKIRVNNLQITAVDEIKFYSDFIDSFLLLFTIATNLSNDDQIIKYMNSLYYIIMLKEKSGIERATTNMVLSQKSFVIENYSKLIALKSDQQGYLNLFQIFADSEFKDIFISKYSGTIIDSYHSIKKRIYFNFENQSSLDTILPEEWFTISTNRINMLFEIEKELSNYILKKTIQKEIDHEKNLYIQIAIIAVIISTTIVFSIILSSNVTKRLKTTSILIEKIGAGDLTIQIEDNGQDEIGSFVKGFNLLSEQLSTIIKDISKYAKLLSSSSGEMNQSSVALSEGIETLFNHLNFIESSAQIMNQNILHVSSSIEEMTKSFTGISQNSNLASNMVKKTNTDTASAISQIKILKENAKGIESIVESITNIANETNLLALNAGIEAASAGLAGKGFAIVASEVKNLSLKAKGSTILVKEKADLMQSSSENTSLIIYTINDTIDKLAEISWNINTVINQIMSKVSEINLRIHESTENSQKLSLSLRTISDFAKWDRENSRKVTATADDLMTLSNKLNDSIKKFQY